MAAILAIYARENGAGTMFEPEPAYEGGTQEFAENQEETVMSVIDGDRPDDASDDDNSPDDDPPPRGGRPALRVVK